MNKSPHLDRDWLYQRYVVDGLSTYDIGKIVGRDPKRIYEKLKDFGIPTRPRGHNLATSDDCYMRRPGVTNPFQGKQHTEETRRRLSEKAQVEKPWLRGERNGMAQRRGPENPNYKDGSTPERQLTYSRHEWKAVLRAVYARDNYHCVRCGASKTKPRSLHAHHLKPWAGNPELRLDLDNLVTLCPTCHRWVHSKKNTEREYLR